MKRKRRPVSRKRNQVSRKRKDSKKAQIISESAFTLVVALAIIIPLVFFTSQRADSDIRLTQAQTAADQISSLATSVGKALPGTQKCTDVFFPEGIISASAQGENIYMKIEAKGDIITTHSKLSSGTFYGRLPIDAGRKTICAATGYYDDVNYYVGGTINIAGATHNQGDGCLTMAQAYLGSEDPDCQRIYKDPCDAATPYDGYNYIPPGIACGTADGDGNWQVPIEYGWDAFTVCGDGIVQGDETCDVGTICGGTERCNLLNCQCMEQVQLENERLPGCNNNRFEAGEQCEPSLQIFCPAGQTCDPTMCICLGNYGGIPGGVANPNPPPPPPTDPVLSCSSFTGKPPHVGVFCCNDDSDCPIDHRCSTASTICDNNPGCGACVAVTGINTGFDGCIAHYGGSTPDSDSPAAAGVTGNVVEVADQGDMAAAIMMETPNSDGTLMFSAPIDTIPGDQITLDIRASTTTNNQVYLRGVTGASGLTSGSVSLTDLAGGTISDTSTAIVFPVSSLVSSSETLTGFYLQAPAAEPGNLVYVDNLCAY